MKATYLFTSLVILFTIFSCKEDQKEMTALKEGTYLIKGEITGIEDSTKVYINEAGSFIDSTYIIDNKFSFEGNLEEPKQIVLQTKDFKENGAAFLWVENERISVTTTTNNLKDAIVKGGPIQEDQNFLKKKTDSLNKLLDWIEKKYRYAEVSEETRDSVIRAQTAIFSKMEDIEVEFVQDFPNSHVSLNILNIYKTSWDKELVKELYNSLNPNLQQLSKGVDINNFLSLPEKPEIGDSYVDFELPKTDGQPIKVSDIKAEYVLVEFWASWCGPCRKENPNLVKTYNSYKNKGFEILGVSLDARKDNWLKAIEKDGLPWIQASDLKAEKSLPALLYGVNAIPYNFLIDKKGTIIAENLRGDQLERKLKELL